MSDTPQSQVAPPPLEEYAGLRDELYTAKAQSLRHAVHDLKTLNPPPVSDKRRLHALRLKFSNRFANLIRATTHLPKYNIDESFAEKIAAIAFSKYEELQSRQADPFLTGACFFIGLKSHISRSQCWEIDALQHGTTLKHDLYNELKDKVETYYQKVGDTLFYYLSLGVLDHSIKDFETSSKHFVRAQERTRGLEHYMPKDLHGLFYFLPPVEKSPANFPPPRQFNFKPIRWLKRLEDESFSYVHTTYGDKNYFERFAEGHLKSFLQYAEDTLVHIHIVGPTPKTEQHLADLLQQYPALQDCLAVTCEDENYLRERFNYYCTARWILLEWLLHVYRRPINLVDIDTHLIMPSKPYFDNHMQTGTDIGANFFRMVAGCIPWFTVQGQTLFLSGSPHSLLFARLLRHLCVLHFPYKHPNTWNFDQTVLYRVYATFRQYLPQAVFRHNRDQHYYIQAIEKEAIKSKSLRLALLGAWKRYQDTRDWEAFTQQERQHTLASE